MKKLLSYLAPAAMLLLASCSSEPSDWTADKKVSLDMVPPGTRISENYDQNTTLLSQEKKGALNGSKHILSKDVEPGAAAVMSADVQGGTALKPGEGAAKTTNPAMPDSVK